MAIKNNVITLSVGDNFVYLLVSEASAVVVDPADAS